MRNDFKVGDKVRFIRDNTKGGGEFGKKGEVVTIIEIGGPNNNFRFKGLPEKRGEWNGSLEDVTLAWKVVQPPKQASLGPFKKTDKLLIRPYQNGGYTVEISGVGLGSFSNASDMLDALSEALVPSVPGEATQ